MFKLSIRLVFAIFIGFLGFSCSIANEKTDSFKVWGNCDMCKKNIEEAANEVSGVGKADWNVDSGTMIVYYDSLKTDVHQIQKAIAMAGYDTQLERGDDKAYQALEHCCQYDRKE